jgi:4-amino-4-deoxy-L-arabinose transferase-like glycosyltransferase
MTGAPQLGRGIWSPDVRRWLPLIMGLAVGLRLALGWMHPFTFPDWADYDALARALVAHQPYETGGNIATRMPGYPLLVAAIYAICGTDAQRAVAVVQAFLGGGVVLITYLMGRRVSPSVGLVAAALVAVDPLSVGFSAALLTETPFTLCFMAALWVCVRNMEETRFGRTTVLRWAVLGVLWGAAVYLRASALWAIAPLAGWTAWRNGRMPLGWRVGLPFAAIAVVLVMLMPWLMRNYRHFHSGPLRLTTLEGISFYESVYPEADGGPRQDKIALPADMQRMDEAQRNDEWSRRGWHSVREDPLRIAKLAVIKMGRTWSPWLNAAEFRAGAVQWGLGVWYGLLFLAGLAGIFRGGGSGHVGLWGVWLIPIAYFTAVHAIFLGSVRYRVPLMPLVCLLAAAGINSAIKRWGSGQRLVG